MRRRMLPEEKKLVHAFVGKRERGSGMYLFPVVSPKKKREMVSTLVAAVLEDCAKENEWILRYAATEAFKNEVIDTGMADMESPMEEWINGRIEDWKEEAAAIRGKE